MRRRVGHVALVVTVGSWIALVAAGAPISWRILLAFPATISTAGYLQAYLHFCANFGAQGVFNVGPTLRHTHTVAQAEFRRRDRLKAAQIATASLVVGLGVALLAVSI